MSNEVYWALFIDDDFDGYFESVEEANKKGEESGMDFYVEERVDEPDQFRSDAEADADALASAGWGTDEDYGYYGGEDY